jgi:uroporphyrin-3 C-methyltransferase
MSDIADSSEGPAKRPESPPPNAAALRAAVAAPKPRRSVWRWLWLPLLLTLIAPLIWFQYVRPWGGDPLAVVQTPTAPVPAADVEVETLRRTLDDAARVNRAMREQLLGLTQRVGLLEDGLAGVERGAAPGIDAVRLAEADFLLRLGEERLRLFSDVVGAREAFALADSQLSEVSDPRATSVRQTLVLERDALAAVAVADLPVILARLDRLADGVTAWPLRGREPRADAAGTQAGEAGWWSRLSATVDRYFRVRRVDPDELGGAGPLLRERIALDLSRARLLLLRAQGEPARATLESTRALVAREFDDGDARVADALGVLDEIRGAPLVPQWPELGESRRELARLRGKPVTSTPNPADSAAASVHTPAPTEVGAMHSDGQPAQAAQPDAAIAAPDQAEAAEDLDIDGAEVDPAGPGPSDDAGLDPPIPDGR